MPPYRSSTKGSDGARPSTAERRLAAYRDRLATQDAVFSEVPGARSVLRRTARWTPFVAVIGSEPLFHRVAEALGAEDPPRQWTSGAPVRHPSRNPALDLGFGGRAVTLADVATLRVSGAIDLVLVDPDALGPFAELPRDLVRPFKADDGRDPGVVVVRSQSKRWIDAKPCLAQASEPSTQRPRPARLCSGTRSETHAADALGGIWRRRSAGDAMSANSQTSSVRTARSLTGCEQTDAIRSWTP